jgi:arginyl-tRNA synthetase
MKKDLVNIIKDSLKMLGVGTIPAIEVEVPPNDALGDLATPVAMSLSKVLKKPPRKIAEELVNFMKDKSLREIDIVYPGFINSLKEYLCRQMKKLLQDASVFLREDIGKGKSVQVEFISANPTGPLHLGHGRGGATGEALSNLLHAAGFRVEREYYINDAGKQVRLLGLSVFARYQQLFGMEYPFPEEGYKGGYIEEIAKEIILEKGRQYIQKSFDEVSEFYRLFL